MRIERREKQLLALVAVGTSYLLSACADKGPSREGYQQAPVPENTHNLSLDHNPTLTRPPTPTVPRPRSNSEHEMITKETPVVLKPVTMNTTPISTNDFENSHDSTTSEDRAFDEYVVHWENFNFGHNLETVRGLNDLIVKYSEREQLPPDVVAGIIFVESSGFDDGNEITGIGKAGIMPFGPLFPNRPTAEELLDDEVNISWGTSILNIILHNDNPESGGQQDMFLSVALYNAGHVDDLLLPNHGWYYARKVFYSIGMASEFNEYIERKNIQLED